jgi:hypothetical protein
MERLNKTQISVFVVAGVVLAAGILIQATPKIQLQSKTEAEMEEMAPRKVGDFEFRVNHACPKPNQSYIVDERTYTELKPFGVVGRIYENYKSGEAYDVLLIAGNDKNSFHDNRVCFESQGFQITKQEAVEIDTTRGKVPATFLTLQHKERGVQRAVMFYKGPHNAFYPLPQNLTFGMLVEQLKLGTNLDSVFYRIMPVRMDATNEQLVNFTKLYLEEAQKTSNGFF